MAVLLLKTARVVISIRLGADDDDLRESSACYIVIDA